MTSEDILRQADQQFKSSDKLNVQLVDQVVHLMNNGVGEEQRMANLILTELKKDPNSWTKVDAILQFSSLMQSKYFALQILEDVISTRWKTLPNEQREGIRNFIVQHILELSGNAETLSREQTFLQKLDLVLVQIVKQDWPKNWPAFIPELVASSNANTHICTNNMHILSLLSEEVFDFGNQNLTQAKEHHLKTQFCQQFGDVFQLCLTILKTHPTDGLVHSTLKTLHRFLSWIPTGYVFDTDIIDILTTNYLNLEMYRGITLRCLTEIASIDILDNTASSDKLRVMFYVAVQEIQRLLGSPVPDLAGMYARGTDDDQVFISILAQFLCGFFKKRIGLVEVKNDVPDRQYADLFHYSMSVLVSISTIEEVEIFKITLDFWNQFTSDLYRECPYGSHMRSAEDNNTRRAIYKRHLSDLRLVVISKMAKPEEVLVVENDQGEVVREAVKDTDSIVLYRTMREVLIYLTHLDRIDTQMKMNQKLAAQVDGSEYSWKNLNTLCWAIGSISGALTEEEEKKFVVNVIRDLLGMVENRRGKDNKAVIASNIMYVVGQYPRFLRAHWKFLKTVINKLFEFMHESHDGVQDMACDTFIKIVIKTKKLLVMVHPGEGRPFIEEIIENMPSTICDLTHAQQNVFYEAVGHIIAVELSELTRVELLEKCMLPCNNKWDFIIRHAQDNVEVLGNAETLREVINIFKSNSAICKSLGAAYLSQMSHIYSDALSIYRILSGELSSAISAKGEDALKDPTMKLLRNVKREFLILLSTWISQMKDQRVGFTDTARELKLAQELLDLISDNIVPPLFEAVLLDYKTNVPAAREPKVLTVLTDIVNQQGDCISEHVDNILGAVFECTLDMINKDMEGWPEHRTNFFQLLSALINHALKVFVSMPPELFQIVMDAIVWAFQHSMRNVAEIGLDIVINILKQMSDPPVDMYEKQQTFYKTFYMSLLQHVLAVTADSNQVQVAGLNLFAEVMCLLFQAPEFAIKVPLNDANPQQSNIDFIYEYIGNIFESHFTHLNRDQIRVIVKGFFSYNTDVNQMKNHLRDFLIQLKEFIGEDSSDLFLEDRERAIQEAQAVKAKTVPGLLGPNEVADGADLEMAC